MGTPSPWRPRHKKKPPKFGDLGVVLRARQARVAELESKMERARDLLPEYTGVNDVEGMYPLDHELPQFVHVEAEIERLNGQIEQAQKAVEATQAEMRAQVRRLFPNPAGTTPRRETRRQLEIEAHRRCF